MVYSAFIAKVVQGLLFASLIAGQILRFKLPGQGGGILISDITVVLFLLVALLSFRSSSKFALFLISPFFIWSISILTLRSGELGYGNTFIALLYFLRLASVILLYPAGIAILRTVELKKYAKKAFVYTYITLLTLGFLQLLFFPNLEGFGDGWDPHIYRMTATWLDPNFFGAFLAMCLPAVVLWIPTTFIRAIFFLVASVAILLTKSRSTYIASAIAFCICIVIWLLSGSLARHWKKILLPGLVTILVVISFGVVLLQERATQLFTHDPTVVVRLEAYQAVWKRLVEPNIFLGVGYNAYQIAAKDAGLISDFTIHSRSGSDSSILTLLVTTGIIGTALFLFPILLGLIYQRSFIFLWATVFLLVHSQFANSLLYPHLLIPYIFLAVLTLK